MTDRINGVSRETYDGMDTDSKLGVLFDLSVENYKEITELKKRGFCHKIYASAGGVIGGILAAIGIKWLGN